MNPTRIVRAAVAAALALVALASTPASAEERGAGTRYARESYPYGEIVNQPLTLPASLLRLDLPVNINLTKDEVGKPWFVPASADLGVTDDVQVGVFHDVGLCLAGKANGCAKTYDDFGGRVLVSISRTAEAQLAAEANVLAFNFDDTQYRAGVALAYKRSLGNVGVQVRTGVDAFVTRRDAKAFKENAFAEGQGMLQLGESLGVLARIRVEKALEVASGVVGRGRPR